MEFLFFQELSGSVIVLRGVLLRVLLKNEIVASGLRQIVEQLSMLKLVKREKLLSGKFITKKTI